MQLKAGGPRVSSPGYLEKPLSSLAVGGPSLLTWELSGQEGAFTGTVWGCQGAWVSGNPHLCGADPQPPPRGECGLGSVPMSPQSPTYVPSARCRTRSRPLRAPSQDPRRCRVGRAVCTSLRLQTPKVARSWGPQRDRPTASRKVCS